MRRPAACAVLERDSFTSFAASATQSHYVGRASNVDERLEWHNAGPCGYTLRHRPWRVIVSMEFPSEPEAARFERYLKSGSGRAFAKRHFAAPEMTVRGQ